ncbi:hypothetical protein UA44_20850, partial [Klebsiella aerogenes]
LGLADGTTSTLVTSGSWALNRFFDKARTAPGSSSLSRQATFTSMVIRSRWSLRRTVFAIRSSSPFLMSITARKAE